MSVYHRGFLQERRKYGKLGWNVPYDFNETDHRISLALLSTYLTKAAAAGQEAIPWGTLRFLIGEAMYGEPQTNARSTATTRHTFSTDRRLLPCGRPDCLLAWLPALNGLPACMFAGGRVSDSFDRRILSTYLDEYMGGCRHILLIFCSSCGARTGQLRQLPIHNLPVASIPLILPVTTSFHRTFA